MDGDLLLRLTDEELQTDLGMKSGLTRKRYTSSERASFPVLLAFPFPSVIPTVLASAWHFTMFPQ